MMAPLEFVRISLTPLATEVDVPSTCHIHGCEYFWVEARSSSSRIERSSFEFGHSSSGMERSMRKSVNTYTLIAG